MNRFGTYGLFASVMFACACAGDDGVELADDPSAPEMGDIGEASEALTTWRTDQTAEFSLLGEAPWGFFRQAVYCNPGTWAVGFSQKVESGQGSGDDTTANAVKLACSSSPGGSITESVESHAGWYGAYGNTPKCTSGFVSGARMKVEGYQGSGDDTAVNAVEMSCTQGANIGANNNGPYGGFNGWTSCAANTRVCGLALKLEDKQGSSDDAAMTGLKLFCCSI